jgi:hypothetical protein
MSISFLKHCFNSRASAIGTAGSPVGVSVQSDETVYVATTENVQIFKNGKTILTEAMKSPKTPSSIAARPTVIGEFAVGAQALPPISFNKRIQTFMSTPIRGHL